MEFIKPGLGNIATYFTVNMGDMETYAVAVPQTITGVAMYAVAAVLAIAASFSALLSVPQRRRGTEHESFAGSKRFCFTNRRNVIIYGAVIIVTIVLAVPPACMGGRKHPGWRTHICLYVYLLKLREVCVPSTL